MASAYAPGNTPRSNALRPWLWGGAACLLLVPAVAMRFGAPGVAWSGSDFLVMGLMLAVACGLYELGARLGGGIAYRAGFGLAVLTGLLTAWVNLAVGMLGGAGHPANLMFAGVLAVAGAGSLLVRFRAAGMARVMMAAGIAQLAAVGVALGIGGFAAAELALAACFALPWLVAGVLFARAA